MRSFTGAIMILSALLFAVLPVVLNGPGGGAYAQEREQVGVPGYWRGRNVQLRKPDLDKLSRLHFLAGTDFPPFNYRDEEQRLTGFNVDLARAICEVLNVECIVEDKAWEKLLPTLVRGKKIDAVLASVAITPQSLAIVDFTDRYYETPARFVVRFASKLQESTNKALKARKVAVVKSTAHAAYLRDFFPDVKSVTFKNAQEARTALKEARVDALFGDGISLVFWLNGTNSANCCRFLPGAFMESRYFGAGVGIAVKKGDRKMREILNYALEQVRLNGRFEELYLRYFPLSFY